MADISIAKGAPEAESANQHGLPVGGNIRGEAEQLRNEVTRLRAALRDETNGRRRHRRFPGNGATAVLATPGHLPTSVVIHDLAQGGAAVNCDWKLQSGTDVTLVLPGAQGVVSGHVVRSDGDVVAVMFQQDPQCLEQLDRALAKFGKIPGLTEPFRPPAADGADLDDTGVADARTGSGAFSIATTSRLLTESKVIPFAVVRDGRLAFANPAFMSLFRADKDIAGMTLPEFLALESRDAMGKLFADPKDTLVTFNGRAIRLDGASFDIELLLARETLNEVSTVCVFARDVTCHRSAEQHLSYLAYTDVLTGLPNRALLMDRLRDAVVKARTETSNLAVLVADLDGFKTINDTFGHQIGDIVLQATAQRFLECVRDTDTLARLGGDEFCVLLPTINDVREAEMVATRFVEATRQPIAIDGQDLRVGVSVGIALFPDHGSTGDAMLAAADAALYDAKRGGRNRHAVASVPCSFKTVSLPLITWTAAHDVGVRMIDKQHRQLAEHINDLAASLRRGDDPAAISQKLETALSYTRHHFESEERLMDKFGFKDAAAHAQLLDDLQSFSAGWDIRSLSLTARFLQEWLLHHVETADRALAIMLTSRGIQ
jgi:diguanylate cyclase (GGDEF)-like protein/hemerythrin-like metal-binding protein